MDNPSFFLFNRQSIIIHVAISQLVVLGCGLFKKFVVTVPSCFCWREDPSRNQSKFLKETSDLLILNHG